MKTIGKTKTSKTVYAGYAFHQGKFSDWTVNDHRDAADLHRKAARTDIKTNQSMHEDSAKWHEEDAQRILDLVGKLGLGKKTRGHATRKSPAQLDCDIAHALAKKSTRSPRSHATVAYRIKLTPSELRAVEFARGRYSWPDMLSAHAADDGTVAFTESEMWQWTDDVDSDDSPFPLAAPALAAKLQRFYDERV